MSGGGGNPFKSLIKIIVGAALLYLTGGLSAALGLGTVGSALLATGAALLTSRLINGSMSGARGGGGGVADQGTRVQLSPSTENKIPVLYGGAYCNPIITDAYLDNQNKTMTYVMVIAETCNVAGATYTVEDIYWNDLRLYFGNSSEVNRATEGRKYVNPVNPIDPKAASGPYIQIANEDHIDKHFDDRVYINVYAGNTSAAKKIFGANESGRTFVNKYNSANWELGPLGEDYYRYEGLITAMVRVNYDAEKGFTGLPQLTFKLRCSIDNPAAVLADYMTSDRYGCNIPLADIDSASLAAFETFCDQQLTYKPYGWNVGDPLESSRRYTINGLIDTSRTCKSNIDTILLNSGAWLSYDVALGKWRVIPKRALPGTTWSGANETGTPTDPAPQILFSDDNIVSGIQISSTRLDSLFNAAEIEYYDKYNRDQRGYVKIALADNKRNYNEPDNALSLTLDLVTDSVQAERIANLELKQSRDDLVIQFTTSHYGLQAQAGDVIGVYNVIYGWCEPTYPQGKYFRVLSTTEKEIEAGGIVTDISALEYNADVYSNEDITQFITTGNIGIIPRTGSPNIPAPIVTIGNINGNSGVPSFKINVTVPGNGGPYDELQIWVAEDWDWLGKGGDVSFTGQIFGTTLDVITIAQGDTNVVRALTETYGGPAPLATITGIGTTLSGTNVLADTIVQSFGANFAQQYGNGKTGQYTITPSHSINTAIRTMKGWVQDAKFTATVAGNVLTVTAMSTGTIQLNSLIRLLTNVQGGASTGFPTDCIIVKQLTGTTGSTGTYELSKVTTPNITTPTVFVTSKPYPSDSSYRFYRSVTTKPGFGGLFDQGEVRDEIITGLAPNSKNKKYFVRCRLGINKEYGPLSDISEVDLEPAVVYWNPDSQSALNIKKELVKMDFGKFIIPRNGLWLMRTLQQFDGGTLSNINGDRYNLDLGNLKEEQEISSADEIQKFTFDPDDVEI